MIIKELPFIWRLTDAPNASRPFGVPDRLDFEWDWDPAIGLLKQKMKPALRAALDAIYAAGSENLGATSSYGKAFVELVKGAVKPGAHVLEIGPGCGWLAKQLPGIWISEYRGNWPEGAADLRYDVIVHHHVLEHVEDPAAFLAACRERLAPGGVVICAVPDCTESVLLGDISMATSQHLNYFTERSLAAAAKAAGFGYWEIEAYRGTLTMTSRLEDDPERIEPDGFPPETFGRFYVRSVDHMERIRAVAEPLVANNRTGFYCPMRLFPYAHRFSPGVRLFDDVMCGRYLDGIINRIEGFDDFERDPVDLMFVMSLTHEREIVQKLSGRCKVITLREMLNAF